MFTCPFEDGGMLDQDDLTKVFSSFNLCIA
jgi:hypothetical protein